MTRLLNKEKTFSLLHYGEENMRNVMMMMMMCENIKVNSHEKLVF